MAALGGVGLMKEEETMSLSDARPFRAFKGYTPHYAGAVTGVSPEYSGWQEEQLSWKNTCYVGDWSFVPQISIKGPDAHRLFSDLSVNKIDDMPLGRAKHCVQVNEDGKVIAEGILLRHAANHFEYQAGTPQWVWYKLKTGGYDATASMPVNYKLQISGPNALALCEKLKGESLREVKFMWRQKGQIDDMSVDFLRQGMAGEIGFELQGPIQEHGQIMQAILAAGEEFGIRRLGARNLMINHLEACYPTGSMHFYNALSDDKRADYHAFLSKDENLLPEWQGGPFSNVIRYNFSNAFTGSWDGNDITELYRSPVEMGWGRTISLDHDFIGRDALAEELKNPRRQVVTLEFDSASVKRVHDSLFDEGETFRQFEYPDIPYQICWTDLILKNGKVIGHATHPGYSRHFKKMLALSFIDVEHAELGSEVSVLWGDPGTAQTELKAIIRSAPYKQDQRRMDLKAL